MASADSLNFDVLELIFAHLSRNDLVSVAIVSRSFLTGALPKLYRHLDFRLCHAKRYPSGVTSPFAIIIAKPALAVYVREIDIGLVSFLRRKVYPQFIRECTQASKLCPNVCTFKCKLNIMAPLLPSMKEKTSLRELHINANLTNDQASLLVQIANLRTIALEFASYNVLDKLPGWVDLNSKTLESLTICWTRDLNECVLASALMHTQNLLGLHIIGCPRVDHLVIFRLVQHTPWLESLSLTASEDATPLTTPSFRLFRLRHLALDGKITLLNSSAFSSVFTNLIPSSPPLSSVTLHLNHPSIKVAEDFVKSLISDYSRTLKKLAFVNCTLPIDLLLSVCQNAICLERLELAFPVKQLSPFTLALSTSSTLHTLVDIREGHITHGPRIRLNKTDVGYMMSHASSLSEIITDDGVWTQAGSVGDIQFEKITASEHSWFMPFE